MLQRPEDQVDITQTNHLQHSWIWGARKSTKRKMDPRNERNDVRPKQDCLRDRTKKLKIFWTFKEVRADKIKN